MAAPRKHIRKIMSHENEAMTMLWKTGVCTKDQIEEHFNIKSPRLKKLCHSKYLKEHRGKIWLNEKGIKHLEKLGMEHRYKTSTRNVGHDLRLTEKYLSLNKEMQRTWKTESQLRHEAKQSNKYAAFQERIEALSRNLTHRDSTKIHATPDAAVYSKQDNGYIAIEITTRNYKYIDIQQKIEFSNTFLAGYTQD